MPYEYSILEVQDIATRAGTGPGHINKIITGNGKYKTKSHLIANLVSGLTGKPPDLYLVSKGVKIDAVEKKQDDTYDLKREPATAILITDDDNVELAFLSDIELWKLNLEVRQLQVDIWKEMQKRVR